MGRVALIGLDDAEVQRWTQEAGIAYHNTRELTTHPRFLAYLEAGVAHMNAHLARYETVKRYAIVAEDFSVENGLLTPTLKIRRRQIADVYHQQIEHLYLRDDHSPLTGVEHVEQVGRQS